MDKTITTYYKLNSNIGLRIAHLSDLHQRESDWIVDVLKKEKPDIILITGDLMERCDEEYITETGKNWTLDEMNEWIGVRKSYLKYIVKSIFYGKKGKLPEVKEERDINSYNFLSKIVKVAPVYYSAGNHEWYFKPEDYKLFYDLGIILLNNSDTGYKNILLGGLPSRYDLEWLKKYAEKDGYKILLMHHPEYYKRYVKELDDFDLILSGHAHGGQWRFCGHGILSPGQGILPKYHHGKYDTKKGCMIVSSGLGNTTFVPRYGNPCEVVIIDI